MELDQALNIINQATAKFVGTREDHVKIQVALETIKSALPQKATEPKPEEPKAEETKPVEDVEKAES